MHIRQAIRERIASNVTGLSNTGSNVFQSRVHIIQEVSLPCILVYTQSETSVPIEMGEDRTLDRTLSVMLEVFVKAVDNTDDTIDAICVEIEEAMGADTGLNGLAKDSYLVSTAINYVGEGDQPMAVASLNYEVEYQVSELDLETAI